MNQWGLKRKLKTVHELHRKELISEFEYKKRINRLRKQLHQERNKNGK